MTKETRIEAAVMVIYDTKDKTALLEERTRDDRAYFGENIPLSGLVDEADGGDPSITAVRELEEELGVTRPILSPLADEPLTGEYGQLLYPFLVTGWEGEIPRRVIGSGNPLHWESLEQIANSRVPSVAAIAKLAIKYLDQGNRSNEVK